MIMKIVVKFVIYIIGFYLACCVVGILLSLRKEFSEDKISDNVIELTKNCQTACEELDFQKAYGIVLELKKISDDYDVKHSSSFSDEIKQRNFYLWKSYKDAEKYVVLQEAIYIIENQGVEGLPRISVIVKEHEAGWVYNELIDIAIALGDETLEARLKNLANPKK